MANPLRSKQTLALEAYLSLFQVFHLVCHLVNWAKAIIIYPMCETNVYILSPHADTQATSLLVEDFVRQFPSHIGIQRNETVDKQAKTSLSLEPTSFKIPFSNFKPSINKYILEEWQTSWNNSIGNKLLDIKPNIGEHQSVVQTLEKKKSFWLDSV